MFLSPTSSRLLTPSGLALLAGTFALGLGAGLFIATRAELPAIPSARASAAVERDGARAARQAYPVELIRVVDGDTFEAQVQVWPGIAISTKVRLRGIDAPELFRVRCAEERDKAIASRDALADLLAEGSIAISDVSLDKYGGRVVADASTRRTADVARALLARDLVRPYDGGRRDGWC